MNYADTPQNNKGIGRGLCRERMFALELVPRDDSDSPRIDSVRGENNSAGVTIFPVA